MHVNPPLLAQAVGAKKRKSPLWQMTRPAYKALPKTLSTQPFCAVIRLSRNNIRSNRRITHSKLSMTAQFASHGRGGAGNMADAARSPSIKASDLETPVLKTAIVTTGRGGTGNMTKNNDPYETRLRQDVKAVPRRLSAGAQYAGRGGAGNVFKGEEELEQLARQLSGEQAIDEAPEKASEKTSEKNLDKAQKTEKGEPAATIKKWLLFGRKP
ncbi:hypothetical protein ACQKWADRAFT_284646 [Trichoderma austrokoningii]